MSDARRLAEAHYQEMNDNDFSAAGDIFSPDLETIEPGSGSLVGLEPALRTVRHSRRPSLTSEWRSSLSPLTVTGSCWRA